jgi:hypothetical protein
MRRTILTTCFTLACGVALLSAQTPSQSDQNHPGSQSGTSSSQAAGDNRSAKGSVKLTGCLQAGTEPNTFVLNNASEATGSQSSAGSPGSTNPGSQSSQSGSGSQAGSMGSNTNPSEMARTDMSYVLIPNNKKMDLSQHIGQRVEVTGSVVPGHGKSGASSSGSADSSGTMGSAGSMAHMQLKVRSIRQVSSTCP